MSLCLKNFCDHIKNYMVQHFAEVLAAQKGGVRAFTAQLKEIKQYIKFCALNFFSFI